MPGVPPFGSPPTPDATTSKKGKVRLATPAIVLGSAAAAGSSGQVIQSDSTIVAFDATVPSTQAFSDAAAVGTAAFAARRDHKHAMPADPFTGAAAGGSLRSTYPNPAFAPGKIQNFLPLSYGGASVLAESLPRFVTSANTALLSTGRSSGVTVAVLAGTPCTNAQFQSGTTAANGPTHWWFGLADYATLSLIRQSTDQLTAAWAGNTVKTLALDSIPVTAGSRSGTTTVTLTIPTLFESLASLVAVNDVIVVSNANIATYNGTFTVTGVTATTITYISTSATDSLSAPFPTVQLAAGKRVYTPAADTKLIEVLLMTASSAVISSVGSGELSGSSAVGTIMCSNITSSLTGTCDSPLSGYSANVGGTRIWAAIT